MPLEVEVIEAVPLRAGLADALGQLLAFAGEVERRAPRGAWTLALRVADDAEIAALHGRFFGDPTPTDVISFPSGDDLAAEQGHLGDVVISLDTARGNAAVEGHTPEREVAFLALHGLLHVCGYDDASDRERALMLRRQIELLERFEREHGRPW